MFHNTSTNFFQTCWFYCYATKYHFIIFNGIFWYIMITSKMVLKSMIRVIIRGYLYLRMAVDVARYMNFRRNKIEKSTATFRFNFFFSSETAIFCGTNIKTIVLIPDSSPVAANIRGEGYISNIIFSFMHSTECRVQVFVWNSSCEFRRNISC